MDKLTFAPVELTLYDENDEEVKTLSKSVIRWGNMKKAMKLAAQLDKDKKDLSEESIDALSAFVCQLFDDKVTPQELEDGADIGDVMTCFKAVVHRASSMGNV